MSSRLLATTSAGFGPLLSELRRDKGITQTALAEKALITPEHLCRIEKGDRPAPRASTVERIIVALGLSSGERSRLLAAAGYQDGVQGGNLDTETRAALERFLGESAMGLGPSRALPLPLSPLPPEALQSMPASLHGTEAVVQAAVALFRVAAATPPPRDARILLSFFSGVEFLRRAPELRLLLSAALRGAMEKGWNVCQLWRLDDRGDGHRSLDMVAGMMQYLGFPGQYEPYFFHGDLDLTYSPAQFILVPGAGALLTLTTSQESDPNGALLVLEPGGLKLLSRHFDLLLSRARPLLTVYPSSRVEGRRFDEALTHADEMDGDRFIAKDGLSTILIPPEIWSRRMGTACAALEEPDRSICNQRLAQMLSNLVRRRDAFELQVSTGRWRFLEVCPKSALVRFVRDGVLPKDDWLAGPLGAPPLTLEERRDVLNELLRRLEYPNYELALLNRREEELARVYWIVKGQHAVFLESWRPIVGGQEAVNVGITERSLVQAFRAFYLDLWEKLGRQSWDKRTVRQWVSRQVEQLQDRIDKEFTELPNQGREEGR